MKKFIVTIGMLVLATLVACGGSVDTDALVDQAADAAKDGLNAAQDAIEEGVDSAQEAIQDATQEEAAEESGAEYEEGVNFWPQVGEGIVISTLGAEDGLTLNFNDPIETGFFTPQEDDLDVRIAAGLTYSALTINPNADVQALLQWSVDEPFLQDIIAPKLTEIQGMSSQDVMLMRGDEITIDIQSVDPAEPRGALDVTFNIFRDSASVGLFSFVTSGDAAPREIALLAPVLASATPTAIPPTETPVPEGVSEDWVELVSDTLQDPVFLTGFVLDDGTTTERDGQVTLSDGDKITYNTFSFLSNHPLIGVTAGMEAGAIIIANQSASIEHVFAQRAKSSESELGKAAFINLDSLTNSSSLLNLKLISSESKPVKEGDLIEISLGTAGSSELPYKLKIYSGETNELLVEFEINQ